MSDRTIIGGITANIEGNPFGELKMGDSNPGKITMSYGGVGRNIVENLARLGADAAMVSVVGDDFVGRGAVQMLAHLGVNVENINLLDTENTAIYLSILNIFGEMELALCDMEILDSLSIEMIKKAMPILKKSKIVGLDTNLKEEIFNYLLDSLEGTPLFLDPVSAKKAERVRSTIGRFHTIKPNRIEAEAITGLSVLSEKELKDAGRWFEEKGVKRIFITLSGGGVYYKEGIDEGIIGPGPVTINSATGAGDAFSAAIIDGYVKGMSVLETARYGMSVASIALESREAVNSRMSYIEAKRRMENV